MSAALVLERNGQEVLRRPLTVTATDRDGMVHFADAEVFADADWDSIAIEVLGVRLRPASVTWQNGAALDADHPFTATGTIITFTNLQLFLADDS